MAGHKAEDDRAEQHVRRGRGADLGSDLAAIERALPKSAIAARPASEELRSTAKRRGRSRTRPATGQTPGRVHCCRTHSPDGPARSGRRPRNPCQARESPPPSVAQRLGRDRGPGRPVLGDGCLAHPGASADRVDRRGGNPPSVSSSSFAQHRVLRLQAARMAGLLKHRSTPEFRHCSNSARMKSSLAPTRVIASAPSWIRSGGSASSVRSAIACAALTGSPGC